MADPFDDQDLFSVFQAPVGQKSAAARPVLQSIISGSTTSQLLSKRKQPETESDGSSNVPESDSTEPEPKKRKVEKPAEPEKKATSSAAASATPTESAPAASTTAEKDFQELEVMDETVTSMMKIEACIHEVAYPPNWRMLRFSSITCYEPILMYK
jgi:hypothetical protein